MFPSERMRKKRSPQFLLVQAMMRGTSLNFKATLLPLLMQVHKQIQLFSLSASTKSSSQVLRQCPRPLAKYPSSDVRNEIKCN